MGQLKLFHAALRQGVHTMRRFMLKKNAKLNVAEWLDRKTVYEGKLMSMTGRVVRLFAPDPAARQRHVDLSYDWVIPIH
jgi:hypothetical protein